jgi:hypothetical protein
MTGIRSKLHVNASSYVVGLYGLANLSQEDRALKARFLLDRKNLIYENIDVPMLRRS